MLTFCLKCADYLFQMCVPSGPPYKRVEDLLKSGDVTNLELLVEEEKTFFGGFRPVSFVQCPGPRKDSSML